MRAWIVMTALPPTRGHLALIRFAERVSDGAEVVVCTQPGEPYVEERVAALRAACRHWSVRIHHLHRTIQQEPDGDQDTSFWKMWREVLCSYGLVAGDAIVASEEYGAQLARVTDCIFMSYDLERSIVPTKATAVRQDPATHIAEVVREFQPHLRRRVTLFGAESVGKTTMTRLLASRLGGHQVFEWARPYLECAQVGSEVTLPKMTRIWRGQLALQEGDYFDKPFIFQDTDLFSTLGYWQLWNPATVPSALVADAVRTRSDLYLVLASNIPFEPDLLRYGGETRETPDSYWIELCRHFNLPYQVITSSELSARLAEAVAAVESDYCESVASLVGFRREGAEYEGASQ